MAGSTPGLAGPTFSVIIPTYNRAGVILRAVQSVLAQTCQDFEIIVIDDGSTDATPEVLQYVTDRRLHCIWQSNRGRSAARNVGAAAAKGQYLAFLDSDDEALPTWLAQLNALIDTDPVGVVSCGAYVLSLGDGQTHQQVDSIFPRSMGDWYDNVCVLFRSATFAVRRDVFFAVGAYAIGMEQSENTELGRRLAAYCNRCGLNMACVKQPLVRHYGRQVFNPDNNNLFQQLLDSNKYMLKVHRDALRSAPHRYAYSCAIVGVNAARLGRTGEARRYLWQAVQSDPLHWKHYIRLLMAIVPGLGQYLWLRSSRLRS